MTEEAYEERVRMFLNAGDNKSVARRKAYQTMAMTDDMVQAIIKKGKRANEDHKG